ncbi:hypothetical protein K461DRAFT_267281 [Myriangium duriaei CBS 260.36]|uniref:GET complex, subunit GET2 n=1 Tax=Myriangium duriaei CBS 260.36 TaxID=1168546 RepID=A0A9P4J8F4_9PEZI|nr:hypothetical protein K461DRAFT_267281 [Myriangium duriaei CBS 260.36]
MADTAEESPAQRQARLRREKRNARITSEGTDRLAKITGVSGRPAPAVENVSQPPPQPTVSASVDDPAEVDISEHHWRPEPRRLPSNTPTPRSEMDPNADPMMQMMQQMLAGMPGGDPSNPNAPNGGMPGLPPFMQSMMSGQQKAAQEAAQPVSDTAYVWRIVHAVFALSLAVYVAMTTTFNGTKLARNRPVDPEEAAGPNIFYIFATVETVLQSSRYFLEKGQLQGAGWLATIANSGMVPEPWVSYIRVAGRYMTIWTTVVGDAMTVVFVLGVIAWWKGMATA